MMFFLYASAFCMLVKCYTLRSYKAMSWSTCLIFYMGAYRFVTIIANKLINKSRI